MVPEGAKKEQEAEKKRMMAGRKKKGKCRWEKGAKRVWKE